MYCLVENNAVAQGPMLLPFSSGNVTGLNVAPDPTIYGWYPYNDPGVPIFDGVTQTVVRSFVIDGQAKTVTQAYAIEALPLTQIANNQHGTILQSYQGKLKRRAMAAIEAGDTKTAVQYLMQQRSTL